MFSAVIDILGEMSMWEEAVAFCLALPDEVRAAHLIKEGMEFKGLSR